MLLRSEELGTTVGNNRLLPYAGAYQSSALLQSGVKADDATAYLTSTDN